MVEWKKLGEVCTIRNGYTPSTKIPEFWENGNIPWFTLEDIRKNGRYLNDAIKHITLKGVKKGVLFPKNSIIISTTATIGEYALIRTDFLCNQQISCISIIDNNAIDTKYLFYLAEDVGKWCKRNVNGGGSLLIVSTSKLQKLEIPIPSLSEQQRIVEQLDTFTSSIENLKEQIAQRRKQYEYYRDQLLDLEGKEGVEIKTLGEACGIFDGTHQTPNYKEFGIRFVSVENIKDIYSSSKYISIEDYQNNYKTKPQKNDVLMTRIGDVGSCAVIDRDEPIAYYVSLALLRPSTDIVLSNFIKYILESKIGKKELRKRTLLTAVPLKINLGDIGKINLPFPSLSEQQRIVSILDTFEASIRNLEQQLAQREKQYEYYRNKLLTFE